MDFFSQQDQAKKKTRILLFYFSLCVLFTVLAVYAATAGFLTYFNFGPTPNPDLTYPHSESDPFYSIILTLTNGLPWFDSELFILVAVLVGLMILTGSSLMRSQLSQGGKSIATMLGGEPLNLSTTQPEEIKLRNVVEEMAIASGLPMPQVYVLNQESGINAFAAGFTYSDAVVGVTRGCLNTLTRDELQGVVAHEFSHILNGDMTLNMRLSCLAHGILFISSTGQWLLSLPFRVGVRGGGGKKDGAYLALLLIVLAAGAALTLIGWIGYFFSALLKASISRQREFLADSSAVQFTRNTLGISGVLKKIGGFAKGSRLESPHASQASHFFFSQGIHYFLGNLLSTHPPLADRIRAIDPTFNYEFPKLDESYRSDDVSEPVFSGFSNLPLNKPSTPKTTPPKNKELLQALGQLTPQHIQQATKLRASIPSQLYNSVHEPFGARALLLASVLADSPCSKCEAFLNSLADQPLAQETQKLALLIQALPHTYRLPLIDLSLPALKMLSAAQYQDFRHSLQTLIESDLNISLFEYTLQKVLLRNLELFLNPSARPAIEYHSLKPILESVVVLLAALSYLEEDPEVEIKTVFMKGCEQLNISGVTYNLLARVACGLAQVEDSLNQIAKATPLIKKNILYACATVVMHDKEVQAEEESLLRAIAESLDCPIPLLIIDEI